MIAGMIKLDITGRRPAYGGRHFGDAGSYELIHARVYGALDPAHPSHAGIVNLDRAPRDENGMVGYACEAVILKPADLARGNGWLLYDVLNRGEQRVLSRVHGAPAGFPAGPADDPGDALLLEQGYTIVWSGWQGDIAGGGDGLVAHFPVAGSEDEPIVDLSREEWTDTGTAPVFAAPLTWPAATDDPAQAVLSVRALEGDLRDVPDDLAWRYRDSRTIEIERPAGYDSGAIYEFIYPSTQPIVMGMAFPAVRDLVSFLRFDTQDDGGAMNPLCHNGAPAFRHALFFGVSQSGRFVRDFLWQGFNSDLAGRPLFDAAMPVVAGSRKTFVNAAFAQPGRFSRQHEDHLFPGDQFPFAYTSTYDPIGDDLGGILDACEAAGAVPKIVHFDTESEIWAARASLLVTDGDGNALTMPDHVRLYLASGVQHSLSGPLPDDIARLAYNPIDYAPMLRPLIVGLRDWVEGGDPLPPSRFPSAATENDGPTLTTLASFRADHPAIPGLDLPERLNELAAMDYDTQPPTRGGAYTVLVSRVDGDGNALGGLRHPLIAAPLGTYTGWNLRNAGHGEGDLLSVLGGFVPFARTEADRAAANDPRPSIEARYTDRATYLDAVEQAARALVADRLMLEADLAGLRLIAEQHWDDVVGD
ncbi:unnamed protein product [Discosporangium mesarthrocarpum]